MTSIVFIIVIFAVLVVVWMWHNLGDIEKTKKITYIVGSTLVMYFLTFIIYNISKIGIKYENKEAMNAIRAVYVSIFTIVNSALILPYLFKKIDQLDNEEIKKEEFKNFVLKLLILFVIIFVFEDFYFGSIQQGILSMINR